MSVVWNVRMCAVAAEHDRDWGGGGGELRRCSHLVTAVQRPWGWVREGGSG